MFAEIGCDFALWGDPSRALPVNDEDDAADIEHVLPFLANLRARLLDWASEYRRYDKGERDLDMSDFDERGMLLSRELHRGLWPIYPVSFGFTFAGSRERLLLTVFADTLPGWGAT